MVASTYSGRNALDDATRVVLVGAAIYVAARFSQRGALVNLGFWLPVAGLVAVLAAGGAREVALLLRSRLAIAAAAYVAMLGYGLLVAPDSHVAWRGFLPAHGRALVSALFVAYAASRPEHARWLLISLVVGALLACTKQAGEHFMHWQATGRLSPEYQLIRTNAPGHAFYLPAIVAMALLATGWRRALVLAFVVALETVFLLLAAARGSWLSVASGGLVAATLTRHWKLVAALGAAGVAALAVLALAIPDSQVAWRFQQGFSTSGRVTGTWGPALDLIRERPIAGYGYGQTAFHEAFDAAAPRHPDWTERASLGPHNIYLAAWFAGGPLFLLSMLWLFAEMALVFLRVFRQTGDPDVRSLALAGLSSLVSAYLVQGFFEDTLWLAFGILLGLALGLERALARTPRCAPAALAARP